MLDKLRNNVPLWFAVKFLLLFGVLYAANYVLTGLLIPGGYYSQWMDEHLDYVSALRNLVLHGGQLIVNMFGYETALSGYKLTVIGYGGVRMVYSCIGINILCFWVAFIIAFPNTIKSKIAYGIFGLTVITILNMIRVGALALIRTRHAWRHANIDHHAIFNIVVYAFIFLMMMRMINNIGRRNKAAEAQ